MTKITVIKINSVRKIFRKGTKSCTFSQSFKIFGPRSFLRKAIEICQIHYGKNEFFEITTLVIFKVLCKKDFRKEE